MFPGRCGQDHLSQNRTSAHGDRPGDGCSPRGLKPPPEQLELLPAASAVASSTVRT